jgi:hypothetical protein
MKRIREMPRKTVYARLVGRNLTNPYGNMTRD